MFGSRLNSKGATSLFQKGPFAFSGVKSGQYPRSPKEQRSGILLKFRTIGHVDAPVFGLAWAEIDEPRPKAASPKGLWIVVDRWYCLILNSPLTGGRAHLLRSDYVSGKD
jgi:hypothetical protein